MLLFNIFRNLFVNYSEDYSRTTNRDFPNLQVNYDTIKSITILCNDNKKR